MRPSGSFIGLLFHGLSAVVCKVVGHKLNSSPLFHYCERCEKSYAECYRQDAMERDLKEADKVVKKLIKELKI